MVYRAYGAILHFESAHEKSQSHKVTLLQVFSEDLAYLYAHQLRLEVVCWVSLLHDAATYGGRVDLHVHRGHLVRYATVFQYLSGRTANAVICSLRI